MEVWGIKKHTWLLSNGTVHRIRITGKKKTNLDFRHFKNSSAIFRITYIVITFTETGFSYEYHVP